MKRTALATGSAVLAAVGCSILAAPADATGHAARQHGIEKFSIISTTDPSTDSVIATGVFTAGGTDHAGSRADKIQFPDGLFTLRHTGPHKNHVNTKTCMLTTTGHGQYTLEGGTRAYKGIKGSGKYSYTVHAVFPRTVQGTCDTNGNPSALQYVVTGRGPASLP